MATHYNMNSMFDTTDYHNNETIARISVDFNEVLVF